MVIGFSKVIYPAPELPLVKAWYQSVLRIMSYFIEPLLNTCISIPLRLIEANYD